MNTVDERETALPAGATVVIACGPSAELAKHLAESVRLGARQVVVDLGDAEMIDASTLATLRRMAGKLRERGGCLSVVSRDAGLTGLLDLTLLSRSFSVFGSLDAALRAS